MPTFMAFEFDSEKCEPTGKVEYYLARGKKDALRMVLYTRQLKDRRCRSSARGLPIVHCPSASWAVVREKKARQVGPKKKAGKRPGP